ncbi:MAG: hypothetical protein J6A23_04295, partial [Thermoguttaceae bacterium]|nr:hypothetical protein [Thermoguttaceae bacterium]
MDSKTGAGLSFDAESALKGTRPFHRLQLSSSFGKSSEDALSKTSGAMGGTRSGSALKKSGEIFIFLEKFFSENLTKSRN